MPWQAASSSIARTRKPEQPKGCLAGTAQGEVSCLKLSLAFVFTNMIWFRQCAKPVDPYPPETQPSGRIISWVMLGAVSSISASKFWVLLYRPFKCTRNSWSPES